ncbi:MAG: hypothetical protein MUF54_23500 [Polyangiaceae bacterium]|jgi:hypothetical protein|nr:hypothetical protein [Polyangiaceae bacterium]
MMTQLTTVLLGLSLSLTTAGCNNPSNAAAQTSSTQTAQAVESAAATKVARVVFVGKENACDCTRKSIDAGWAALQKALGTPAKVPVERLQIDTQGDKVAPYRQQKAMMALPAIYFVDGKSAVLELLQGEVTEAQIASALKR